MSVKTETKKKAWQKLLIALGIAAIEVPIEPS